MVKIDINGKSEHGKQILGDISLEFCGNALVFITGKSGAGKTTLLNIIAGNDDEFSGEITCGKYHFSGTRSQLKETGGKTKRNAGSSSGAQYRKNIGIVNQDFNLIGALNVRDNILLGAQIAGTQYDEEEYSAILELLDLEKLQDRRINLLSGGEKQRVAIARALIRKNNIILADEPTGNLDPANSKNIYETFKRLSSDRLIIVVSHDIEAAELYGDRIIELEDGIVKSDRMISVNKPELPDASLKNSEGNASKQDNARGCTGENYVKHDGISRGEKKNIRWQHLYVLKGIKHRRKQMLRIVIPVIISMLCVFLALGFFCGIDKRNNEEYSSVLEMDRFIFYIKNYVNGEQVETRCFTGEDTDRIGGAGDFKYILPYYSSGTCVRIINDDDGIMARYHCIDQSQYMRDRYRDIQGKYPVDKYEILVDSMIAGQLSQDDPEDCIGRKIKMEFSGGCYELTISGIKKSYSLEYSTGSVYMLTSLNDEMFKNNIKAGVLLTNGNGKFGENCVDIRLVSKSECSFRIVQGRDIEGENEILVSTATANSMIYYLKGKSYMHEEDINTGAANDIVFGEYYITDSWLAEIGKYNVVGIIDSDDVVVCIGEYPEKTVYTAVSAYASDFGDDTKENITRFCEKENYMYEQNSTSVFYILRNQAVTIMGILGIFSLMILIISVIVIGSFMKLSIEQRKYEMGVLRNLGLDKSGIFVLLLEEQFILSVAICACLSVLCAVPAVAGAFGLIRYGGLSIYANRWWHFLIADAMVITTVIAASIPGMIQMSGENISGAIASRYD